MVRSLLALLLATTVAAPALAQEAGKPVAGPPPGAAPTEAPAPAPDPATLPFGVTGLEVAAERDRPQVCLAFNRDLPEARPGARGPNLQRFVEVAPQAETELVVRGRQLCVEGLAHGQRYTLSVKAGLPSANPGELLAEAVERPVEVPNRRAVLAFRGAGYVLPRIGPEGLPLRTTNVERARLAVLRIADRALVEQIYYGRINQTLTDFDVGQILEQKGERVWGGEMAIGSTPNQSVVTPFPLEAVTGALPPGVYVAVAEDARLQSQGWDTKATQWFVVSDLGLTAVTGSDGISAFARSLASAKPQAGVELRLVARNNQELGRATTGPDGIARFAPDLVGGSGDTAPQALFAYTPAGDFGFLDLGAPAIELAESAAGGRPAPGALDAWAATDRGVYRPGDTVHLTALLRDADARAVTGRPLTLKLVRPDGLESSRRPLEDRGAGGYVADLALPASALAGTWKVTLHVEAEGPAVGQAEFTVDDFGPPRLDLAIRADRKHLGADGKAVLSVEGDYLYGAPAAGLPGELSVTLRPAATPFPEFAEYRFGLAQQETAPEKRPLPGFTTGADGTASVTVEIGPRPQTTRPLEAVFRATLFEVGGRPVSRELALPLPAQPFAIGIRPRFAGDAVPEGAAAGFDIVALSPEGKPIDRPGLSYDLYEEEYDYSWYEANGRWDYKTTVRDRRLTGGGLDLSAAQPKLLEEQVKAGRYRLEVFDPASGVATSVRFSAGWWVAATVGDTPDRVEVAAKEQAYKPGETASVFVRPPYPATVLVTVADRAVRRTIIQEIGKEGAFLDIPVEAGWTGGAYVVATAFAPADGASRTPRRAVGMGWLPVSREARTLDVKLELPEALRPRATATVPVTLAGMEPGAQAFLTVQAVDSSVMELGQAGRGPLDWYLGKRRLAVQMRDVYGPLRAEETARPAPRAATAETGPRAPAAGVPKRSERVAAVYSGVVTVGADGRAEVPLAIPDFQGQLRLTATAWSADRLGRAEAEAPVRELVAAELALPRFLAPGDKAQVPLTVENVTGPKGTYTVTIAAEGPLAIDTPSASFAGLTKGRRVTATRTLTATGAGTGRLILTVKGPEGVVLTREMKLPVRPAFAYDTRRQTGDLAPGQSLILSSALAQGLRPETATVALAVSGLPQLDVAGNLMALQRQQAGGAERILSRSMPLLYVNDIARDLGLPADAALKEQVQQAIDRLMSLQRADGSFSQWPAAGGAEAAAQAPVEPWLTAYALDFLSRAREAGYLVAEVPYRKGLDWLARSIGNNWVEDEELPARAYALYAAARAKAIDVSAVRYFQDNFWNRLPTRLARAQVGGALALLGDGDRARGAFDRLEGPRLATPGMRDYGSDLRDRAAALAIMAESGMETERLAAAGREIRDQLRDPAASSAQEQSWLVMAGHALIQRAGPMRLALDGKPAEEMRPFVRLLPAGGRSPAVVNSGDQPVSRTVSVAGVPATAPAAEAKGFTLKREVLDTRGKPVDLRRVAVNDLLVVVLSGRLEAPEAAGQALLVDPLPAGLEIENVRLAESGPLGGLSWLQGLTPAAHVAARDERFEAAVELSPASPEFRLVYLARAVNPGSFVLPPPRISGLDQPSFSARGAAGALTVRAVGK
ncbi:MAG TPA: alpha-2-macroglobulin [Azospirillaceae bacterium]|nr:alpha-2-macroglobulin [Azospirillaceae bacterium]